MGEPFRARSPADDTLARWFNQADRNHDGLITPDEMQADADRFFSVLDTDRDGEIGPEELIRYEWELAPDIQLSSRLRRQPGEAVTVKAADNGGEDRESLSPPHERDEGDVSAGGLEGAARYSLLNLPEPVAAADADFNRAISRAEFEQAAQERFRLLDTGKTGALSLAALEAMWTNVLATVHQHKHHDDPLDKRVGAPLPPDR
jgi:Ca2+-binding EF-hand superfamily protein